MNDDARNREREDNHSKVVFFCTDLYSAQQKATTGNSGAGILLCADQTVKAHYAM
jgi:hypothetical protein